MKHHEELVRPQYHHLLDLASNMREGDVEEILAFTGMGPLEALEASIKQTKDPYCWLIDGEVAAMFGVVQTTALSQTGVPWLLSGKASELSPRRFAKGSKLFFEDWKRDYLVLANFVDARYTVSIRWLKWLGFKIEPAVSIGKDGGLFHPFVWKRDHEVR